ncbi:histone-lysine N-methyltransferase 2D isoform X1 [Pimephales promelas]|uniref:histone-lysine N-methyltransferase 2D isoform X1 n=2 Tax=Pimephales promelas TaxID=90988 RepID=UPI0019555866|nr:histone-lysine N-methyltransferase 2D isoform X1 [Pimephales promelas]KAG1968738.1 paxillin [Pimephales promelas]
MDDLDALLADLESSTAHISKCPVFLPEETPYSYPSGGHLFQDDSPPPPLPPPPSAEALNGSLSPRPDSQHSSQQSLGPAHKSTLSRDSSPPASHTEEDHVYSFPNKQKHSDSSSTAMTSALGSNLSELDRLLLELNAVQQNAPSYSSTEDAAPPLPPCSVAHYIQENGAHPGITLTPAAQDKPQRNGTKGTEDGRPTVESLLNELESSVPSPTSSPCALRSDLTDGQVDTPSEEQGRISATSATRELDELMACLSDFKVQSNPSSLGSLNSEPMFEQTTTIAEIHPPPTTAVSKSLSHTLPVEPSRHSPGLSPSLNFDLHIVEEPGEPGAAPPPSFRLSPPATSSPRFSPVSDLGLDSAIDVSASLLTSQVESLVVLSQTITTTTSPGVRDLCSIWEGNPSAKLTSSGPKSYSPLQKSSPAFSRTPERVSPVMTPASIDLYLSSSEAKPLSPVPSFPRSPIPTDSGSPSLSLPKAVSPPLFLSSSPALAAPKSPSPKPSPGPPEPAVSLKPLPPSRLETPTYEPSLDDALDKLLAMSFSRPENEITTSAACCVGTQPEVYEETIVAADRGDSHLYTHTESEMGDGILEDQSDCRSDIDWADMELKMAYEGPDGSMTPMTEASWMDDSLTPSSCPGTPDGQMDLPMLQMAGTMDRISASGHIKSVIRRTKEIQNVHPMYRDGLIRRKMGPLIFHKSNSQDRLIEELQGKLGIARKDRPKKQQPDDWLTEGVIVMSNPKRSREDHNKEVDKIIIPPESPLPQRKVILPPQSPPIPRPPPPAEEPKRPPPVKLAPAPMPPPPPPAPSPPPREPTPPPQPTPPPPPVPPKPLTPEPVELPAPSPKPNPAPLPTPTPPPASVTPPKVLASVGCQTEYDPLFPPLQIMAQGKGPHGQVNKLDNMLGSLQSDLHKLGVQTVAKGVCGACCKPIVGQVVTAMGRTWHPEHFVCTHCQEEIGSRNFFEREGQPYCERDYHHLFSPRCYYCNGPILDKVVTALDRTWHPEHFFCAQCGAFFGPEGFHEKDGKAYCRKDYFDLFAPKCGGCARAILENYISALSSLWHPECFVCRECFTPFINGSFFEHDGQPYCEVHYHSRRGSLCSGCQKPITGRCITAMGKKFHPEHFVCAFCLKQLNKGTFKEQNDKPYCQGCFIKLFS